MKKTTVATLVLISIILSSAGSVVAFDISSILSGAKEGIKSLIYPAPSYYDYRIEVLSPNGGEIWDRNQIQTIKWQVWRAGHLLEESDELILPEYPQMVSIDLYERTYTPCREKTGICPVYNTVFVKRINTVSLWSKYYKWNINDDIADGKNYIIRITPLIIYREPYEKSLPASNIISSYWDESDKPFTIKGEIYPDLDEAIKSLKKIRISLLETADEIQNLIRLLEELNKD